MSILNGIFKATPIGSIVESVIGVIGSVITTPEDKAKFEAQKGEIAVRMEEILQKRDSEMEQTLRRELEAKEKIIVAEMAQGDTFTKRARPMVVYAGLFMFFFNSSLMPLFGGPQLDLPADFVYAWAGVVGMWSIGRSAERIGARNRVTQVATGTPSSSILGL
jgi:hypothetical protein